MGSDWDVEQSYLFKLRILRPFFVPYLGISYRCAEKLNPCRKLSESSPSLVCCSCSFFRLVRCLELSRNFVLLCHRLKGKLLLPFFNTISLGNPSFLQTSAV